jgi:hypothetical protein
VQPSGFGETSLACICGNAGCPDRKTFLETVCKDDEPHVIITKELVYATCHLSVMTNPDRNGVIRYVFDTSTGALVGFAASTDTSENCTTSDSTQVAGTIAGQHEVPPSCVLSFEGNPCAPQNDAGGAEAPDARSSD